MGNTIKRFVALLVLGLVAFTLTLSVADTFAEVIDWINPNSAKGIQTNILLLDICLEGLLIAVMVVVGMWLMLVVAKELLAEISDE